LLYGLTAATSIYRLAAKCLRIGGDGDSGPFRGRLATVIACISCTMFPVMR